jgi:hypothetical protein
MHGAGKFRNVFASWKNPGTCKIICIENYRELKEKEENYALFNYVNELSHEIEQLNETVQQLQDSIGTL